MKWYGMRREQSPLFQEAGKVWCTTCYKRAYGRQLPSPATRELLGQVPVSTLAEARTLTCEYCKKPLA